MLIPMGRVVNILAEHSPWVLAAIMLRIENAAGWMVWAKRKTDALCTLCGEG